MPAESTHGDIHTGDVSGTFVVGDNNRVTNTTRRPVQPVPPGSEPEPQQRSSAEDQAAVFAVQHGTMHVTYNAEAGREAEG